MYASVSSAMPAIVEEVEGSRDFFVIFLLLFNFSVWVVGGADGIQHFSYLFGGLLAGAANALGFYGVWLQVIGRTCFFFYFLG